MHKVELVNSSLTLPMLICRGEQESRSHTPKLLPLKLPANTSMIQWSLSHDSTLFRKSHQDMGENFRSSKWEGREKVHVGGKEPATLSCSSTLALSMNSLSPNLFKVVFLFQNSGKKQPYSQQIGQLLNSPEYLFTGSSI